MRFMASIYVSDVLDLIALTAEVHAWEKDYGPPEIALQKTLTWPGIGVSDASEWLARALFLASEGVSTARLGAERRAAAIGGAHTLSETGDRRI